MKRYSVSHRAGRAALVVCLACAVFFLAPAPSGAVQNQRTDRAAAARHGIWSVELGAEAQSLWWRPAFRSESFRYFLPTISFIAVNKNFTMPACISAGPTVTVTMPRGFTLDARFLYCDRYNARSRYDMFSKVTGTLVEHYDQSAYITRWEMDTTLRYELFRDIGVFAGIRHTGYDCNIKLIGYFTAASAAALIKESDTCRDVGPRIGVHASLPLAGPLSLRADLAGMYLYAWYDRGMESAFSTTTITVISGINYTYHGLGAELAASLVLRDDPVLTIALGFRYRCITYIRGTADRYNVSTNGTMVFTNAVYNKLDDLDQVWGFTLSATHTFNL